MWKAINLLMVLYFFFLYLPFICDHKKMFGFVWFMVFNVTFNNISVISWQSVLLVAETTDLQQITDKLYHIINVVSSTPQLSGMQTHKVSDDRHWLHR